MGGGGGGKLDLKKRKNISHCCGSVSKSAYIYINAGCGCPPNITILCKNENKNIKRRLRWLIYKTRMMTCSLKIERFSISSAYIFLQFWGNSWCREYFAVGQLWEIHENFKLLIVQSKAIVSIYHSQRTFLDIEINIQKP